MELETKTMIYSKTVTINHPLAKKHSQSIVVPLSTLIEREGGGRKNLFEDDPILDIDALEVKNKRGVGDRHETMDFSMGLSSQQMLLVEVKLRVSNPRNIRKSDLENKIKYSKSLLEQETPIAKEKAFLFNDKVVSIARGHLARLFNNNPHLKVYTLTGFKDCYWLEENKQETKDNKRK